MKNKNYMTGSEFDQFLEDIGGITHHYTDETITSHHYFEIRNGWYGIVRDLITDLIKLGWDRRICQVKEKFGGLEFYVDRVPEGVFDRINTARKLSHTTCEVCGETGELRTDIPWFQTLCDVHYEEVSK